MHLRSYLLLVDVKSYKSSQKINGLTLMNYLKKITFITSYPSQKKPNINFHFFLKKKMQV